MLLSDPATLLSDSVTLDHLCIRSLVVNGAVCNASSPFCSSPPVAAVPAAVAEAAATVVPPPAWPILTSFLSSMSTSHRRALWSEEQVRW